MELRKLVYSRFKSGSALKKGFGAILGLVLILSILTLTNLSILQHDIDHIVNNNLKKIQLATEMRIAARERTLLLYLMLNESDVFVRDELVTNFHSHGRKFAEARKQLEVLLIDADQKLLDEVVNNIKVVIEHQLRVIDLAIEEKDSLAREVLNQDVNLRQKNVTNAIDVLYEFQQKNADRLFAESKDNHMGALLVIVITTVLVFIIGIVIAYVVVRSERKARRELKEMNDSLEQRVEERTEEVRHEQRKVSLILETVKDAIVTCDPMGNIETFNPASEIIFGYQASEVIGKNVSILMMDEMANSHDKYLSTFMHGEKTRDPVIAALQTGKRKNDETFPIEISLNTMMSEDGMKVTALMRDVTERVRKDEEINRLAMTDSLTSLANRNEFNKKIIEAIALSKRSKKSFALLQIDLDKFKTINDTYGHPFGDAYLVQVANILKASCREVDTVARIGGDEFSAILLDIESREDVDVVVKRILDKAAQKYIIDDVETSIGLSIGIGLYVTDAQDVEELIKNADKALYNAKNSSNLKYCYYNS